MIHERAKVWVTNLRRYPIQTHCLRSLVEIRNTKKKNQKYRRAHIARIKQQRQRIIQTRVQSVLSQHRIEATRSSTNRQGRQGNPCCRLIEKISQFLNIPALTTSIEPTALGIVEAEKASFARARKADRKHERCPGRRFVALGGEVPPN